MPPGRTNALMNLRWRSRTSGRGAVQHHGNLLDVLVQRAGGRHEAAFHAKQILKMQGLLVFLAQIV